MWCANRPKALQYMKDAYSVLLVYGYGQKSANGHEGITAPWEIDMNTAGDGMMANRHIDNTCALLNKTLPELRTGFARSIRSAHISAWRTIL